MSKKTLSVALVHDELIRRGGAETVLEELLRLYPEADVYSLYAGVPRIVVDDISYPVQTTYLQRLPLWFRRHPRRLLLLLPNAAEQIDLAHYDVVISSSSGFAKAVVTRSLVPHICYCHTPTRYLWDAHDEVYQRTTKLKRFLAAPVLHRLRLVDFAAAQRVDTFVANSHWTQQRIRSFYGRASQVIYPPVDTTFYTPFRSAGNSATSRAQNLPADQRPFLCVGRLTASKYFDRAIQVCEKLALPLIIVGTGYEASRLRKLAGRHTRFVNYISREQLRTYYRTARALLQPAAEDFGIAAVEAQACGLPVIAYGIGGASETVLPTKTGLLYDTPNLEALADAVRRFIDLEPTLEPAIITQHAGQFSTARWRDAMLSVVESAVARVATLPLD
ncbi:glycosyltransferase [Patescibacteria group bacterium]|nr:glycosyltransferase [Patescibacteria group bacterium]